MTVLYSGGNSKGDIRNRFQCSWINLRTFWLRMELASLLVTRYVIDCRTTSCSSSLDACAVRWWLLQLCWKICQVPQGPSFSVISLLSDDLGRYAFCGGSHVDGTFGWIYDVPWTSTQSVRRCKRECTAIQLSQSTWLNAGRDRRNRDSDALC